MGFNQLIMPLVSNFCSLCYCQLSSQRKITAAIPHPVPSNSSSAQSSPHHSRALHPSPPPPGLRLHEGELLTASAPLSECDINKDSRSNLEHGGKKMFLIRSEFGADNYFYVLLFYY